VFSDRNTACKNPKKNHIINQLATPITRYGRVPYNKENKEEQRRGKEFKRKVRLDKEPEEESEETIQKEQVPYIKIKVSPNKRKE
jgi:hypothetical protein